MNSLTTIVSLSETSAENLSITYEGNLSKNETSTILSTINRKANGLMEFVERYRLLSGIAPPIIQQVRIGDLMQGLQKLSISELASENRISFCVDCTEKIVNIDLSQIEHVLINLLKNAVETKATEVKVMTSLSDDDR